MQTLAFPAEPFALQTQTFQGLETGFFFNTNIRWTLTKATGLDQLVVEHRGRGFFNSPQDLAFDTCGNNRVSVGPVIKLLLSLSFKPTYTIFFFQNRVTNSFLLGRTFDLRIEYRFSRSTGVSWTQALKSGWGR